MCALVAVVAVGACTESQDPEQAPPEARAAPPEPRVCPLTGGKLPRGAASRPAIAVKVENSREARPQTGLEHADLVFEEIVEGGITRFMALYHCGVAQKVGPVRSARFDDPKIALPFTKVLAYSGANAIVERELVRSGLKTLTELNAGDAFFRDPPGTLDIHSLFANVVKLRAQVPKRKRRPPPSDVFDFGELAGRSRRARAATVHFTASNAIEYRWKGGLWKRWEDGQPFMTNAGKQIGVPNVLIQQVEVDHSNKIVDPAGNPSPDITLEGRGKAWLLRNGRVVKGTWRLAEAGRAPRFETKKGERFVFARGPIWIALVPSRKGDVKGSVAIR